MTRYIIGNVIIVSADPLGCDPNGRIDQERTEDTSEQPSNPRSLASVQCPVESRSVVGNVEDHWMRIIRHVGSCQYMQDGAVVQDHCYELEDIDGVT